MAGTLKPTQAGEEGTYIIHGYNMYTPAENLFNQSTNALATAPFKGTSVDSTTRAYGYWYTVGEYLDIEFMSDVKIWNTGFESASYGVPLAVYSNTNGTKGAKLKDTSTSPVAPNATTPNWVVLTELKKGRYLFSLDNAGSYGRIDREWYIEKIVTNKFLILSNDKVVSLEKGVISTTNAIPVMTSDTAPSGIASATNTSGVDFASWKAFDGSNATLWNSLNATFPLTLAYEFSGNKAIGAYSLHATIATEAPKDWIFQGSNDNINWVDLDVRNGVTLTINVDNKFEFGYKGYFKKYRLYITANGGGAKVRVNSFNMFESSLPKFKSVPSNSEQNFIVHGIDKPMYIDLSQVFTEKTIINIDDTSEIITVAPFTLADELGSTFSVVEYTDNPSQEESVLTTEVEPYSVYDYISETPEILVYTELTDDIKVETTTEPFDFYDEFGQEVEVLYYTDDSTVNEANLVLEANYSPIDELQGDLEVVTWTDEPQESAQRVLEVVAIPKPQFIKLVNPKRVYGSLDDVIATDISKSYRDEARYLFANQNSSVWYVWDFELNDFVSVDATTHTAILNNGMKWNELNLLSTDNWRSWKHSYMNIGVFLKDNPRDTITSIVDNISYKDYLPRNSTTVEKANFYILNTTAKIDLTLDNALLKGFLSDDDLTRVQYRVSVNGSPYYPSDGSFTNLGDSPQNIELILRGNLIRIDDVNTIKVEFQDFFGTTDYWQTTFIGTYSGLIFKDIQGGYYSNEIGEVIKNLDFGIVIAGQTTIENEIVLRNQYGYDVSNVRIYANTSNFPTGMELQFSDSLAPFIPHDMLRLSGVLKNNEELHFFVRLKTDLLATPDANGKFDIIVRADKV